MCTSDRGGVLEEEVAVGNNVIFGGSSYLVMKEISSSIMAQLLSPCPQNEKSIKCPI